MGEQLAGFLLLLEEEQLFCAREEEKDVEWMPLKIDPVENDFVRSQKVGDLVGQEERKGVVLGW